MKTGSATEMFPHDKRAIFGLFHLLMAANVFVPLQLNKDISVFY